MAYDHAQSPRLGQRTAVESPGIQLVTQETLPEVAYQGQMVYLLDIDEFRVYDGVAWQVPTAATTGGTQTFVGPDQPVADAVGDLWMNTTTYQMHVWDGAIWQPVVDPAAEAAQTDASAALANAQTALEAANDAQASADGKITTFYMTTEPQTVGETPALGDLWINSTNNRLFRYDPGATPVWTEIQDADIATAINAAGTAQSTADSKIESYYTDTEPTGLGPEDIGDLWFDSNDQNKPYRWNGSAWVSIRDASIASAASAASAAQTAATDAMTAAQAAQATADGAIRTYYQANPPWANNTSQPSSVLGDMWFDTDDGQAYRWNGTTWQVIEDSSIGVALAAAQNAQTTADGKITSYYADNQPTTGEIGDLWFDTNDQNKPYYCSSVSPLTWTLIRDQGITAAQAAADAAQSTANAAVLRESYLENPLFDNWTGTLPAGYTGLSGAAPIKETTVVRTAPYALRYNVAAGANDYCYTEIPASKMSNQQYVTVTADFYLISGTVGGAGVLARWNNDATGFSDVKIDFNVEVPSAETGKWYRVQKTIMRPATFTGTYQKMQFYPMGGWTGMTTITAKNIVFDQLSVRPATTAEVQAYNAATASSVTTLTNTVNTKIKTFYQDAVPTSVVAGDLWIDTNDGNKLYRANAAGVSTVVTTGNGWYLVQDSNSAQQAADNAQQTADTKAQVYTQPTAPTGLTADDDGDQWYDTSVDPIKLWKWNGTTLSWVEVVLPSTAVAGDGHVPGAITALQVATTASEYVHLAWPPMLLNDVGGPQVDVVTYEIYVGTVADFDHTVAEAKVGETASAQAFVSATGDGMPLEMGTTYYFKVRPKDKDGYGVVSNEVSGELSQIPENKLGDSIVTARTLAGMIVLGSTLTSRSLDADGRPTGPGVDLTPTGLFSYGPDGEPQVDMPNIGTKVWRGNAEIEYLTVKTLTTLLSTSLSEGAVFTLQSTVQPPGNPPAVSSELAQAKFTFPWSDFIVFSVQWDSTRSRYVVCGRRESTGLSYFLAFDSNRAYIGIEYAIGATAPGFGSLSQVGNVYSGVVQRRPDGTYYYVWMLKRTQGVPSVQYTYINNGGYSQWALESSDTLAVPHLTAMDDLDTFLVGYSTPTKDRYRVDQMGLHYTTPNVYANFIAYRVFLHPVGDYPVNGMCVTSGDFGAPMIVFTSNQGPTGERQTYVYEWSAGSLDNANPPQGARRSEFDWYTGGVVNRGIIWRNSKFESYDSNRGVLDLFEGGGNTWAGALQRDAFAAYTWGDATRQTTPSPVGALTTFRKRRRLVITGESQFPAGVDRAKFYYSLSSDPATLMSQGTDTVANPVSLTVSNLVTKTPDAPTSNQFVTTSSNPAQLKSRDADGRGSYIQMKGSGAHRLGELVGDETGKSVMRVPHTFRYISTGQNIPHATSPWVIVNFNLAPNGQYEITVDSPGVYRVHRPGIYRISTLITFASNQTGYRAVGLMINGLNQFGPRFGTTQGYASGGFSVDMYLETETTISISAWQNSGAALGLVADSDGECYMSLTFVGSIT